MGQNSSSTQATSDVFSSEEVQRLEKRFKKLDSDASGSISISEFISIPELKENPLGNAHLIFSRIPNLRILNFILVIGYLGFFGNYFLCVSTFFLSILILRQVFVYKD